MPQGLCHYFINLTLNPMAMIWVYAGDKPDRIVMDELYCHPEKVKKKLTLSRSSRVPLLAHYSMPTNQRKHLNSTCRNPARLAAIAFFCTRSLLSATARFLPASRFTGRNAHHVMARPVKGLMSTIHAHLSASGRWHHSHA